MRDVSSPVVEVVLAGGGSHIAKVRELMETRFPGKLFDAMQLTRDEGAAAGGAAAMVSVLRAVWAGSTVGCVTLRCGMCAAARNRVGIRQPARPSLCAGRGGTHSQRE